MYKSLSRHRSSIGSIFNPEPSSQQHELLKTTSNNNNISKGRSNSNIRQCRSNTNSIDRNTHQTRNRIVPQHSSFSTDTAAPTTFVSAASASNNTNVPVFAACATSDTFSLDHQQNQHQQQQQQQQQQVINSPQEIKEFEKKLINLPTFTISDEHAASICLLPNAISTLSLNKKVTEAAESKNEIAIDKNPSFKASTASLTAVSASSPKLLNLTSSRALQSSVFSEIICPISSSSESPVKQQLQQQRPSSLKTTTMTTTTTTTTVTILNNPFVTTASALNSSSKSKRSMSKSNSHLHEKRQTNSQLKEQNQSSDYNKNSSSAPRSSSGHHLTRMLLVNESLEEAKPLLFIQSSNERRRNEKIFTSLFLSNQSDNSSNRRTISLSMSALTHAVTGNKRREERSHSASQPSLNNMLRKKPKEEIVSSSSANWLRKLVGKGASRAIKSIENLFQVTSPPAKRGAFRSLRNRSATPEPQFTPNHHQKSTINTSNAHHQQQLISNQHSSSQKQTSPNSNNNSNFLQAPKQTIRRVRSTSPVAASSAMTDKSKSNYDSSGLSFAESTGNRTNGKQRSSSYRDGKKNTDNSGLLLDDENCDLDCEVYEVTSDSRRGHSVKSNFLRVSAGGGARGGGSIKSNHSGSSIYSAGASSISSFLLPTPDLIACSRSPSLNNTSIGDRCFEKASSSSSSTAAMATSATAGDSAGKSNAQKSSNGVGMVALTTAAISSSLFFSDKQAILLNEAPTRSSLMVRPTPRSNTFFNTISK